jgi:aspartate aminotransferase-like enzyme
MESLRIPGPTPLPKEVLKALSRQMINHRGPEYHKMLGKATANLKELFETRNDVYILTGSGTGAMEAAVVNMLSPGDNVLVVSIGEFGERFSAIAKQFGAAVTDLKFEMGKPADPDAIRRALQKNPDIKAVLVTHNETSTGVTNDMKAISAAVKEFDKLLIVDAISGLGSLKLPVDEWNLDVVITGSQKGWMAPPGMAMVSVSKKGWQAYEKARMPRFYWDFGKARSYLEKGENPWTPAVSVMYALDVSLEMLLKEGLPNIIARHARVARAAREGVKALGLPLLPDERYASNTVTAVRAANGLDVSKMLNILIEEHQVILASGQGPLANKIFRIGHLGWVSEKDIVHVMSALKVVLPKAGFGSAQ